MADAVVISPSAPVTSRIRSRTLRRFLTHRPAVVGACILVFVAVVAIFAPIVAPYDPIKSDFSAIRQGPSALHWMGTDELGRDLLSRLIYGARTSLMAGVLPVSLALVISIPLGLLSGYVGGFLDTVLMRIVDFLLGSRAETN